MADLRFEEVTKVYGDGTKAVDAASFTVPTGKFCVLVGPSGCGKTTLLRMIAGLESISAGAIRIGGRKINSLPPKDRDIAMVFQNYALYPHLNAYDNIGFGLRMRGAARSAAGERTREVSASLALDDYLAKLPKNLSGGQRQRVAMGRALVRDPKVLLMDEPLSNLDARLRAHMRTEIARLHGERRITTIHVTHDQIEAMTLGDIVVVLRDGLVQQVAAPQELFDRPANVFVAGFIGSPAMNMLRGTVSDGTLTVGGIELALPDQVRAAYPEMSGAVIVGIRPDDVRVTAEPRPGELALRGRLQVIEALGRSVHLYADVDAPPVDPGVVEEPSGAEFAVVAPAPFSGAYGDAIDLAVPADHLYFFDAHTGRALRS